VIKTLDQQGNIKLDTIKTVSDSTIVNQ